MILPLFFVLIFISIVLIILGIVKPQESAQAIIGFFFLFLLSLIILNGNLEYRAGSNSTTEYTYTTNTTINSTVEVIQYSYNKFEDTTSHRIGLYLAIASALGLAGVLFSLTNTRWSKE